MTRASSIVVLPFLFSFVAFGQWAKVEQNQLITYGDASVSYPADRVQFSFGVKGVGSTIEQAVRQAGERASRIISDLQKVGVTDQQIQTSHFNSADNPDGKSWWSSKEDFAAAIEIMVTLDSTFQLLERALNAVAQEQVEYISRVQFSLRNNEDKKLAAYKAAAENARKKADLLASTLGATIASVLYIEDQSGYNQSQVLALQAGVIRGGRSATFLFPGQRFTVESKVRVVFEIGRKQ